MKRFTTLFLLAIAFSLAAAGTADARRHRRMPRRRAHPAQPSASCAELDRNAPAKIPVSQAGKGMLRLGNFDNVAVKDKSIDTRVDAGLASDAQTIGTTAALKKFNGGMVVMTDGFRSCSRNANTRGSAKNSAHLRGHAMDIRSQMGSAYAYAMAIKAAGVRTGPHKGGFYNTCVSHVHIDIEHDDFGNECGGAGSFKRKPRKR